MSDAGQGYALSAPATGWADVMRLQEAGGWNHRCGYCLTTELLIGAPMEIEHIIPTALGGQTEESNLWLACSLCND